MCVKGVVAICGGGGFETRSTKKKNLARKRADSRRQVPRFERGYFIPTQSEAQLTDGRVPLAQLQAIQGLQKFRALHSDVLKLADNGH